MAVPSTVVPFRRVTVDPASAVPVMVGVLSRVAGASGSTAGACGTSVSMPRVMEAEAGPVLPAASRAVAVSV